MKKILIFKPLIDVGGTEISILNLVKFLNDYDIYIGYSDENSEARLLDEFSKYTTIINLSEPTDIKFDILILATSEYHSMPEYRNIMYDKKYLWFHRFNNLNSSVFTNLEELHTLDGIISVSNATSDKLISIFPFLKEKITTIYNIIDSSRVIEDSKIPIELNLANQLNLVTTARISIDKGFLRMATLAKFLKKANIDFKWFIIGESEDKDDEEYLTSLFDDCKENIVWLGFTDNPHNIVKQCDYSVLLCDEETWGLVLTEAMIVGVPCISTDFSVAYEQIENGKNGIILSRDRLDYYEDVIEEIVSNKEKYRKAVAKYSYDNDKILKQWKEFLQ